VTKEDLPTGSLDWLRDWLLAIGRLRRLEAARFFHDKRARSKFREGLLAYQPVQALTGGPTSPWEVATALVDELKDLIAKLPDPVDKLTAEVALASTEANFDKSLTTRMRQNLPSHMSEAEFYARRDRIFVEFAKALQGDHVTTSPEAAGSPDDETTQVSRSDPGLPSRSVDWSERYRTYRVLRRMVQEFNFHTFFALEQQGTVYPCTPPGEPYCKTPRAAYEEEALYHFIATAVAFEDFVAQGDDWFTPDTGAADLDWAANEMLHRYAPFTLKEHPQLRRVMATMTGIDPPFLRQAITGLETSDRLNAQWLSWLHRCSKACRAQEIPPCPAHKELRACNDFIQTMNKVIAEIAEIIGAPLTNELPLGRTATLADRLLH
jgi:hypothetical protein